MNLMRALILCLLLALTGCAAAPADPLAYQNEAAELSLTGKINDLSFSAELTLLPVAEAGVDARGFSLVYTAPVSLEGIILTCTDGTITLTRGGIALEDPDGRFAAMALPAALFCIDCELGGAAVIEQNGTTLNRIEAADDEGSYVLWLDESGFPRRIEGQVSGRVIVADILRRPYGESDLP